MPGKNAIIDTLKLRAYAVSRPLATTTVRVAACVDNTRNEILQP
jgi:hypothetical protein